MNRFRTQAGIGLVATLGWPLVMSRYLVSDFYLALGVLATALAIVTTFAFRDRLRAWFKVTPATVAFGVGAGVAQALTTHVAYRLVAPVFPPLREQVIALYELMSTGIGPTRALPIIVLAVVVEELVWRGALLESEGTTRASASTHAVVSTLMYTIAQAGTGSWALALTAFVGGWAWWAARRFSRSLTAAVLMHLVWSLLVLVFVPLEPLP